MRITKVLTRSSGPDYTLDRICEIKEDSVNFIEPRKDGYYV